MPDEPINELRAEEATVKHPGLQIRAEIDAFTVKSLLMINGGGIVALLAFVSAITDDQSYPTLRNAAFAESHDGSHRFSRMVAA